MDKEIWNLNSLVSFKVFAMHSHQYLLDICMDIITDGFVEQRYCQGQLFAKMVKDLVHTLYALIDKAAM